MKSAARIIGQAIGLLIITALAMLWVIAVDALLHAPQPTKRNFPAAVGEHSYSRAQPIWELP